MMQQENKCGSYDTHDNKRCKDIECVCPCHLLEDGTRINLKEVLNDLSKVVGNNVEHTLKNMGMIPGLLYGIPKHSNFYYVIVNVYNITIPLWFAKKYTDIEPDCWTEYIEKE